MPGSLAGVCVCVCRGRGVSVEIRPRVVSGKHRCVLIDMAVGAFVKFPVNVNPVERRLRTGGLNKSVLHGRISKREIKAAR